MSSGRRLRVPLFEFAMTDAETQPPDSSDQGDARFAETRLHEPGETISQQEQDIALVAELLEAGSLSERQIAAVMGDWSIHGSVPLAKHIEDRGLLPAEQIGTADSTGPNSC